MNKIYLNRLKLIKVFRRLSFSGIFLFAVINVSAQQYNVAGTAIAMSTPGCYQLTNALSQAGAVWNVYQINLTQPFDITLTLNFGNRPDIYYDGGVSCGADGMSFVLQPLSSGQFGAGSGVGFHGITPSVGVIMDTYHFNPTDPTFQHISISKNGDELHGTINELVSYTSSVGFPANITDGLDHLFRFTWTPSVSGIGTLNAYFGNASTVPSTPTVTYTGNIVADVFSGNPNVYWGISGSTGGCWNLQTVCMTTVANFNANAVTCAGIPHDFTSNSLSGLPITSWLWHFGDGDSSTLQNPTHIFTNPGVYNVDLTINNSGGFSSTMIHSVTVNPNPTITITASANPICNGDSAILTASGALTYVWGGGLGSINPITVAPTSTTIYTVTGTTNGCVGTGTDTLVVHPLPVVSISASVNPICYGSSSILTANGASTYTWSGALGTSNPITVSPTTTTIYSVTGTSLGCIGTHTDTIIVNPLPIVNVNTPIVICYGDTTVLTATSTEVGTHYTWYPGLDTINPKTIQPSSTMIYTVIGEILGCSDTATSDITVNPLPFITINNPVICLGFDAILSANGATSYVWDDGSTFNPYTVSPFQTTTYSVTGTDANNCSDTSSAVVTVNPNPSVTAEPVVICSGDTAILTAIGATNYIWNTGDIVNPLIVTPIVTTIYSVTGTNAFSCTDTDSATVTVYPTPVIDFTADPWATELGNPILFTGSSTVPINLWQWDFGDTFTDNSGQIVNHTYLNDGTYIITLIASTIHQCESTINHSVIIETNLFFPNVFTPNSDGINDKFEIVGLKPDKENSLQIFNRWGKKIYEKSQYDNSWTGEGAADGTYYFIFIWKSYSLGKETSHSGSVSILR